MVRTCSILCMALCLSPAVSLAEPAQVLIIRHAEKPDEGPDLSLKGRERAKALVPFFRDGDYEEPVAIFAAGPNEIHLSRRSVETVAPLAGAMKLKLKIFHRGDFAPMVREIMHDHAYDGKLVLIAWEHKEISDIAKAFGASDPPAWPDEVFDRVWVIDFKTGSPELKNAPQRLMYGDSEN